MDYFLENILYFVLSSFLSIDGFVSVESFILYVGTFKKMNVYVVNFRYDLILLGLLR